MAKEKLPSYIKKEDAQNDFAPSDVEFPQLKLAQSGTDEAIKQKEAYIKGLEPGLYFNSITKEVYGDKVYVTPIHFFKENIDYGEGPIEYYNYVVSVNGDKDDLAVLSFKSTGVRTSKRLNSMIKVREAPMFAQVFTLGSTFIEGDKGDWFGVTVNLPGKDKAFVDEGTYKEFKNALQMFKAHPPKIGYDSNTGVQTEDSSNDDLPY